MDRPLVRQLILGNQDQVSLKVDLPLWLDLPRKVNKKYPKGHLRFHLNKNTERNANGFTYSEAKKAFTEDFKERIEGLNPGKITCPVCLCFTIYKKNKVKCDLGNYSVVEKFTADALVKAGVLDDDNIDYIKAIFWFWGGFSDESKAELELIKL